jgi:hypothetical protein
MPTKQPDPLGADFWNFSSLTWAQKFFGAALKDEYRRVRDMMDQMCVDSNKYIGAGLDWKKLIILKIAEVDFMDRDDVYVRRGAQWAIWWEQSGEFITWLQLSEFEPLVIDLDDVFGTSASVATPPESAEAFGRPCLYVVQSN